MLKVETILNRQRFYAKSTAVDAEVHDFVAYGYPYQDSQGIWHIDCTDSGDYCYTFNQNDEAMLYATEQEADNASSPKKED